MYTCMHLYDHQTRTDSVAERLYCRPILLLCGYAVG